MSFLRSFVVFSSRFICLTRTNAPIHSKRFMIPAVRHTRCVSTTTRLNSNDEETEVEVNVDEAVNPVEVPAVDPRKDRTKKIPLELSLKYLESQAYKTTYGDNLVWKLYRRNHKKQYPPRNTRANCVKDGIIKTGNPCPICRDEYLVIDYRNLTLLKQFISPYTDEVLDCYHTGLCQFQHFNLKVAVEKARDYGYLTFAVPQRVYDYADYYPNYKVKLDSS